MNKNKQIPSHWMRFKVSTLAASVTSLILAGVPVQIQASDIDIYQAGGTGTTKIYLMLDVSGSMDDADSFDVDYGYAYTERVCGLIFCRDVERNLCNRTNLTNNLTVNIPNKDNTASTSYTYATSSDNYCTVDLGSNVIKNTNDDNLYKEKIKSVCDQVGTSNVYNCYSRMVNLRRGLISVVADAAIDDKIYFALGTYPTNIGTSKNPKYSGITLKSFTSMTSANKSTLITTIQGLSANGGTPIAPSYSVAGNAIFANTSNAGGTSLECTGNGVYFLTDGEPTITGVNTNNKGYNNGATDFASVLSNQNVTSVSTNTLASDDYWKHIGNFAQSIRSSSRKVKTATVGFGGGYYLDTTKKAEANISIGDKKYFDCSKLDTTGTDAADHLSLCKWGAKTIPNRTDMGGFGEGGFYTAQSSADLVSSIKSFISDTTPPIEGTTMGSSTIPVDALNTSELQPYAYFPMFKPLIGTEDQLWMGNLKKFNVTNGSLFDVKHTAVFKNASDFNARLQDYWYTAEGKNSDDFLAFGGNLSQLQAKMKVLSENNTVKLKRNLLMNINGALVPVSTLVADQALIDREYLYGLLGYSNLTSQNLIDLKAKTSYEDQLTYLNTLGTPKNDYQLGAVIHSSPLLLTQKGVVEYGVNGFTSTDREDYILYGTTQGVLHVLKAGQQSKQSLNGTGIDASGGEEVFAFVPKEMLTKQKTGFIESLAQKRSKPTAEGGGFFYGVDGQWSAHTEYEASIYETAKLDSDGNKVLDADKKEIMLQREGLQVKPKSDLSHQYVYGGLRMGGRSYYGLNLSDISKPQMLFHINPDENTTGPLSYMGQSWSKPTLTYIKWNGAKKLAMIVGGGYDEKYETATYKKADTDIVKGNGIYIFDAKNGDLLWWGSSFAKDGNAALNADKTRVETPASSNIAAMTNSIPSRIKAVDRNGDGISDHLYVGDLGGQVFRIDISADHTIDKDLTKAKKFTINAFKFADLNTAGKNSPRFYEAPTFTIHKKDGANFAVVTLISGDRSSPLVTNDANSQDMIVGLYDNGVTEPVPVAKTAAALTNLQQIYLAGATAVKDAKGWFYKLPITGNTTTKYQSRGLAEGIALDNDLYYSIFNPQKSASSTGSATSCTGGIIGDSTAYKLCLPYGVCTGATDITKVGGLGAGIIALSVGPGTDSNSRTLILNDALNSGPQYGSKDRLLPRRWFEYSPYVGK